MSDQSRLRRDAELVAKGKLPTQHQGSLNEQLSDLLTLAIFFGLYDAADHLRVLIHSERV